uniref:Retrovirus-related Pol polyprotein from transposon TNT 1-94 n=1 Tax=Tanacetum cinerariifolium TaxID=118510 RepID=A0A6L2KLP7_TANCI|nr:hypothetical protein [Tanacetum cinerariifolium]
MNSPEPTPSTRPTQVKVPKELPKVSMVNTSLKKLKHHLASLDVVVKERTTTTAITKGTWGFEHIKSCFRDEIIPFVKALKDLFNSFDQFLVDELSEVQNVFLQMEQAVEQHRSNVNSDLQCVTCNGCLFYDNHDSCVLEFINNVNARVKSKSAKKTVKRKVWKPTGKVFTNIGYIWRPTGRTFTIVGNACPLTRITTTTKVPLRKPIALESNPPKHVVTLVYSRKPKESRNNVSVSKSKINKSLSANKKEHNKSWGSTVSNVPSSSIDECRKIMGYGDYHIGNVTILRAYFVDGLGHNLFFVGQFYDSDLKVAFRQHACFIGSLEGVDLLSGCQGNNLYTLYIGDMIKSSPICLLSKASKTKSWLWHRRLSHLNFDAINYLARQGLVRGLPKLKFEKDHLCSPCAMGKSKKKSHKLKSEDTNQEKLYLLHMDLCGPMRVKSVNGKKYILIIVGISHETSVARSPQQNDVVERHNQAVATACFTQNRSIIRLRHGKTPYEHLHDKLPDLSYFHVFGALCYPTNDSENVGKLQLKAGIAMASEQSSSGPAFHEMTPAIISSGLVPKPTSLTSVDHPAPKVFAPIIEVVAPEPAESTGLPSSTTIDQDAPSPGKTQTTPETQPSVIPNDVEEDNHDIEVAHMGNDPFFSMPIPEVSSDQSLSTDSFHTIVHLDHQISKHNSKWTKDHPLENIIGQLTRSVSTRLQLHEQALFCYYDAFLTYVEPKTYKDALTQSCWIEAMQEELNELERLEVWELIPRPYKVMVITLKWIYKMKLDELGSILKNKARLVACGYHQEDGIDFEESFAPVARL